MFFNLESLRISESEYNEIVKKCPIIKKLDKVLKRYDEEFYGEWGSGISAEENEIFEGIFNLIRRLI
jgi:hypothetical protein